MSPEQDRRAGDRGSRLVNRSVEPTTSDEEKPGLIRRLWNYFFGRSEPPEHPPPPPHSPGAGM